MKIILNHLSSCLPNLRDEEKLGKKIEAYLKKNSFHYVVNNPNTYMDGITLWLDEIGDSSYPRKSEEIRKISDLSIFLFDTLRLRKPCLHCVFQERSVNGEGKFEVAIHTLDKIVFEELTGSILPHEVGKRKLSEFLDEWKKGFPDFV